MKKMYPSKKMKRRAEYLEREAKRAQLAKNRDKLKHAHSIEDMAAALGIKLR